jgi:serine protease Do
MIRTTLKATQLATFSVDLPHPARQGMPTPTGTGFFISPDGWFVTAAHVVAENGCPDGPVRSDISQAWLMKEARPGHFISGMCTSVSFVWINPGADFALLKVDFDANKNKNWLSGRNGFPHLIVSVRELEEAEPVYSFGYPLSDSSLLVNSPSVVVGHLAHSPRVTSAIVASTMEASASMSGPDHLKVYVLDKALNYGNSGGPIVAVETGHVHALCSRFIPVVIPQQHLLDDKGQQTPILMPSLYGVVSSLANTAVVNELRSRGISIALD